MLLIALAGGVIAAISLVRLLPAGFAAEELAKSSPATQPKGAAEDG